jgi:hypothetical protein
MRKRLKAENISLYQFFYQIFFPHFINNENGQRYSGKKLKITPGA